MKHQKETLVVVGLLFFLFSAIFSLVALVNTGEAQFGVMGLISAVGIVACIQLETLSTKGRKAESENEDEDEDDFYCD